MRISSVMKIYIALKSRKLLFSRNLAAFSFSTIIKESVCNSHGKEFCSILPNILCYKILLKREPKNLSLLLITKHRLRKCIVLEYTRLLILLFVNLMSHKDRFNLLSSTQKLDQFIQQADEHEIQLLLSNVLSDLFESCERSRTFRKYTSKLPRIMLKISRSICEATAAST